MTPAMLNLQTAAFCPLEGLRCPDCATELAPLLAWLSPLTDEEDRFLTADGAVVADALLAAESVSEGDYVVCTGCAGIFPVLIEEDAAELGERCGTADPDAVTARATALAGGGA